MTDETTEDQSAPPRVESTEPFDTLEADDEDQFADGMSSFEDRIPIPDAEERERRVRAAGTDQSNDDEPDPYAPEPSDTVIESGRPSLENAVFVLLGAVLMILIMARLTSILAF